MLDGTKSCSGRRDLTWSPTTYRHTWGEPFNSCSRRSLRNDPPPWRRLRANCVPFFARYTAHTKYTPRELWREGAGAAPPLLQKAIPPLATTTVPDMAGTEDAEQNAGVLVRPVFEEEDAAVGAQVVTNATKPLPLMVRNPEPRIARNVASEPKPRMARVVPASPEASVVVRSDAPRQPMSAAALALPLTSSAPKQQVSQDSRSRAIVAGAEMIVAQQRTQLKSPGTGIPVSVATRKKSPPLRIHWHKLVPAVGAGSLVGAVALLGWVWLSNHKDAKADSSAEAGSTVVAPPRATAPPSAMTAGPVPSAIGSVVSEPSAAAATAANTAAASPRPQLVTRREPRLATIEAPAATRSVPSTKPTSRKAKAPAGKLPFSSDELTF